MEIINQLEKVVGRSAASAISNSASCQARVVKDYYYFLLIDKYLIGSIFSLQQEKTSNQMHLPIIRFGLLVESYEILQDLLNHLII